MKRISMAGADVAITDAAVADLLLEYAMHLGRAGTTDIVAVPVPDHHHDLEVDLLLGPSSQIVLSESPDSGTVGTSRCEEVTTDLRARIDRITGRTVATTSGEGPADEVSSFVDFGAYEGSK